eukprot:TRINITY_DN1984_c0_g1_i1.p1 TRINITY_DN1984_c0_g1~~TRINITY_DN1984_c0_g1_i1.p1  ORF type:complete len:409 (+),score=54.37 TRINITY_DN1984_c0_g1_i1:94-1320(+)
MMQIYSHARHVHSICFRVPISLHFDRFLVAAVVEKLDESRSSWQWQQPRSFSFQAPCSSGTAHNICMPSTAITQHLGHHLTCSMMVRACFTSEANKENGGPTEAVKELYEKMLKSVEAETMPPNAWLWLLLDNCANREDIKLLFQILQSLRRFRLSNLRIYENFNCHLCLRVAEACARAGALDYGQRALWMHNVYGLTPSIGSAHYLLLYAKEHNDAKLMVKIMKLLKKNSMPLQPGTADIVFSICYSTNNWDLIEKFSKRFIRGGVKLRRTSFDTWMEFAAKMGDAQSIWAIDNLRSDSVKKHTLSSGFSLAKGYLLERKPESAAKAIHVLNESLPELTRSKISVEIQKLVSDWPSEVIKWKKKEDRKAFSGSLKSDISTMIASLSNMGLEVMVNLENLKKEKAIPS